MRYGLTVSLVAASLVLGSCSEEDGMTTPPGDDASTPPAPPNPPAPVPPPPPGDGGVVVPTPPPGVEAMVQIDVPSFELGPYEETTLCYYTTVRVDSELGIRGWQSSMTEGSHHLIMFFTRNATRPDGTLEECGLNSIGSGLTGVPIWAYSAQEPEAEIHFPEGVGFPFTTEQHLFVQMHYLNPTGNTVDANVRITGRSYPQGVEYQRAGVFVTYNTEIDIPAGESGSAGGSCEVSGSENFFLLSTHSHQFATSARVFDGDTMLVDTTDWEHPAVRQWNSAPFYQFTSGALDYRCTYQNPTRNRIRTGDSAQTDEMCMGVGYFFPSRGMRFCFNDRVISL